MTEPTDAEIESAWTEATGSSILPYPDDMLAFVRAVLAKWGTPPAVAGDTIIEAPSSYQWITEPGSVEHFGIPGQVRKVVANVATPQPTQVQAGAVPLTAETDCGGESCDCRSYCKKKGGQHGADT